ncbi:MAG: hypothetical protein SGI89_07445 [bacterium]|nr:hypothetical protein [bacterium]
MQELKENKGNFPEDPDTPKDVRENFYQRHSKEIETGIVILMGLTTVTALLFSIYIIYKKYF